MTTTTTGPENGFDRAPCVTNASPGTWRAREGLSPDRGEILIKSMCGCCGGGGEGVYGLYVYEYYV